MSGIDAKPSGPNINPGGSNVNAGVAKKCQTQGCNNWAVSGKNHCAARAFPLPSIELYGLADQALDRRRLDDLDNRGFFWSEVNLTGAMSRD